MAEIELDDSCSLSLTKVESLLSQLLRVEKHLCCLFLRATKLMDRKYNHVFIIIILTDLSLFFDGFLSLSSLVCCLTSWSCHWHYYGKCMKATDNKTAHINTM